jgi:molybdopterin/thiamine biosynthesis adenylyltransferase
MQTQEASDNKLGRIAEKVLDRQLRLYGKSLQEKYKVITRLMKSTILIAGLNGTNSEVAKNLALTAINLDIDDSKEVSEEILATNFLFGPAHLGKTVVFDVIRKPKQLWKCLLQ